MEQIQIKEQTPPEHVKPAIQQFLLCVRDINKTMLVINL
jgi:hypothetical protein